MKSGIFSKAFWPPAGERLIRVALVTAVSYATGSTPWLDLLRGVAIAVAGELVLCIGAAQMAGPGPSFGTETASTSVVARVDSKTGDVVAAAASDEANGTVLEVAAVAPTEAAVADTEAGGEPVKDQPES